MSDGNIRSTLREVRLAFGSAKLWFGLLIATVLLGLSGPFNTMDAFSLVPRMLFWGVVVVVTYAIGGFISVYMKKVLARRGLPMITRVTLTGILTGIAVTLFIFGINLLVVGREFLQWQYIIGSSINTFLVASLISAALNYFETTSDTPNVKRLLSRLELDKRGAIISLSVQDHYVEVATAMGQSLLLIRLSDAIAEVDGVNGMQVHRSHWVAHNQIVSAKRTGDRGILNMSNGHEIPVSRSYMKAAKDAGLFV